MQTKPTKYLLPPIVRWLHIATDRLKQLHSLRKDTTDFVDLAPTDAADKDNVYRRALNWATQNKRVFNIALTGPYGSGKSSIIKAFLKTYRGSALQISLAAFLPDANKSTSIAYNSDGSLHAAAQNENQGIASNLVQDWQTTKQEIERSILQQMLYGADARKLPLSRFKRVQKPSKLMIPATLLILLGLLSITYLSQNTSAIINLSFFQPFALSNWLNYVTFVAGGAFAWWAIYHLYTASLGISLKSLSLRDVELETAATNQESILNRHLDEIIYFFQVTQYDLVIIEDLDRFDAPQIFVTLREINSLINANLGRKRQVRFLYALRDDMFRNTDRTKFFEFIVPVIPIINSSNAIDKVLEQGQRLAAYERLDRQFLREVSRYLIDLRLIRNIFNELSVYWDNLGFGDEGALDPNKLLAILIYKNVFPDDFEDLHRGKGKLAEIIHNHASFVAEAEEKYRQELVEIDLKIESSERQVPRDVAELRRIYGYQILRSNPYPSSSTAFIVLSDGSRISFDNLIDSNEFEKIFRHKNYSYQNHSGGQTTLNTSEIMKSIDNLKTYSERESEIIRKSATGLEKARHRREALRSKLLALRNLKFHEILQESSNQSANLFEGLNEYADLARFLVLEGYIDDTYHDYTSLFHAGRLSPSDNEFLRLIRGFRNPEPDFRLDNTAEVVAAMRKSDFHRSYALNVRLVDTLLSNQLLYSSELAGLAEFLSSNFADSQSFLRTYYSTGRYVDALINELAKRWDGFVDAAIASAPDLSHLARIIAYREIDTLGELARSHSDLSEFASNNLAGILAAGVEIETERLAALELTVSDLPSVEGNPAIARILYENGFYQLSVANVDFIWRVLLGHSDLEELHTRHLTSVRRLGETPLSRKIEAEFEAYFHEILFRLDSNVREDVPAILEVIGCEYLEEVDLRDFLVRQTTLLPQLSEAPQRLHSTLLELERVEPSWENCMVYHSGEQFDAQLLTSYLEGSSTIEVLTRNRIPGSQGSLKFRQFLLHNNAFAKDTFRGYMRCLPLQFVDFPLGLDADKLKILIEEETVAFSAKSFQTLSKHADLQLRFVTQNIARYLEEPSEFDLDDNFLERLLAEEIDETAQVAIIKAMDIEQIAATPERAALIGNILAKTGADIGVLGDASIMELVQHANPVANQIKLFNRLYQSLTISQVQQLLANLPGDFKKITVGTHVPRIPDTGENRAFVSWLKARGIISTWTKGSILNSDLRIYLRRK